MEIILLVLIVWFAGKAISTLVKRSIKLGEKKEEGWQPRDEAEELFFIATGKTPEEDAADKEKKNDRHSL